MPTASTESFALVGCGKAGLSVALALKASGWSVAGCSSRSAESAMRGSQWLNCPVKTLPRDLAPGIPLILAVPEDSLREVDVRIAREDSSIGARVVLHLSGALPARALEACRIAGASVGSFHPIMTLPEPLTGARRLKRATFALEGRPQAMQVMKGMATAISGRYFPLSPKGKTLYHAACMEASNYIVALIAESQDLLLLAGADPNLALPAFEALVQGTVENVYASGPIQAMTGPFERGDASTVGAHIQALKRWPRRGEMYRVLARRCIELARKRHPDRADRYSALENLLG
jgi:predicted short-subunit dehydrogenase-like oxidoreductase (DUF2520 family)